MTKRVGGNQFNEDDATLCYAPPRKGNGEKLWRGGKRGSRSSRSVAPMRSRIPQSPGCADSLLRRAEPTVTAPLGAHYTAVSLFLQPANQSECLWNARLVICGGRSVAGVSHLIVGGG